MDNYLLSRDRARAYFLGFDQQAILDQWQLPYDANFLYLDFLGKPYALCRKTGLITRRWDGQEAGFEETLSIFDFLCHEGTEKTPAGRFTPVNSLKHLPKTVGVGTDFHTKTAAAFDQAPETFRQACQALGGTPLPLGDIGFSFPLFANLTVQLKFYHSDEDFPASLTLLWDENLLLYIYYETVFYAAGCLLDAIKQVMTCQ